MKVNQKEKTPVSIGEHLVQFGQNLRAHRMLKRRTHEEVSAVCGFSRQTLSRIEKGDPSVAIGQVLRYAEVLGVLGPVQVPAPASVAQSAQRVRRTQAERLATVEEAASPKEAQPASNLEIA